MLFAVPVQRDSHVKTGLPIRLGILLGSLTSIESLLLACIWLNFYIMITISGSQVSGCKATHWGYNRTTDPWFTAHGVR